MSSVTFTLLVALALTPAILAQSCRPGDNCKEPDCRCWNDPSAPGGFAAQDIPQMVLISFQYGLNSGNKDIYTGIFDGIKNPNGCSPKGTFFVQKENTQFDKVKELFDDKHEIGMTTPYGTIPQSEGQWDSDFQTMRAELLQAGVSEKSIMGVRGPELYNGGDEQFDAMDNNNLRYDSTCTTIKYIQRDNLLFPYTLDYIEGTPECTIGLTPTQAYPGIWQFLVADLEFNGQKCASPSSCSPQLTTSQDAFDMLYESFSKHYEGGRSPFVLYIDPSWLLTDYQAQGTKLFLEFLRISYPEDVWLVTTQQAMAWMREPVASFNASSFAPFGC